MDGRASRPLFKRLVNFDCNLRKNMNKALLRRKIWHSKLKEQRNCKSST